MRTANSSRPHSAASSAGGGGLAGRGGSTKGGFQHGRKGSGGSSASASSGAAAAGSSFSSAKLNNQNSPAGPAGTGSQLPLHELIGAHLELGLSNSIKVQGHLWCYDSSMGCLVLSSPEAPSYRIIRLPTVSSINVLSLPSSTSASTSSFHHLTEPLPQVDLERVREREMNGVREEMRTIERAPPPGTPGLGVELFDALGKTMSVRWTGQGTIIVLEEVLIDPPYDQGDVKSPKTTDPRTLERVKKVLQGEREKLARTRPDLLKAAEAG